MILIKESTVGSGVLTIFVVVGCKIVVGTLVRGIAVPGVQADKIKKTKMSLMGFCIFNCSIVQRAYSH
jgi:hypothetical protein